MIRKRGIWVIVGLLAPSAAAAVPPSDSIKTTVALPVYNEPPRFLTGRGWVLGSQVATIPGQATVRVFERRSIGFFLWSTPWLRVRYDGPTGVVQGWVYGGTVAVSGVGKNPLAWLAALALPTPAFAEPAPPAPRAAGGTPAAGQGTPASWPPYAMMFVAVCAGMAAKGLFDGFRAAEYRRKTLRALLVSPMVLLAFSSLGDFDFGSAPLRTLLIYLGMAFQNGFFWQTVLVKTGETDVASHAASSVAGFGGSGLGRPVAG